MPPEFIVPDPDCHCPKAYPKRKLPTVMSQSLKTNTYGPTFEPAVRCRCCNELHSSATFEQHITHDVSAAKRLF